MTRAERTTLFAGVQPAVRAALTIDGNGQKFEECWLANDSESFFARLEAFATSLGLSAYKYYPHQDDKITARIAADVRVVSERIGWRWAMSHVQVKGRA